MDYENIIEYLVKNFPDIQEKLNEEEYLAGLPHCIFEIVLIPYVSGLCEMGAAGCLIRVGELLEQMVECDDIKVKELVSVSFFEPIVLADEKMIPVLQEYLRPKSLEELRYRQNRYRKRVIADGRAHED